MILFNRKNTTHATSDDHANPLIVIKVCESGIGQSLVCLAEDPVIYFIDLILIELDLDRLLDKTDRSDTCDTVFSRDIRNDIVINKFSKLIDIVIIDLDSHIHGSEHIKADLHDARRADAVGQRALKLIKGTRDLYHRGIHIRAVLELELNHRIVLGTR